MPPCFAAGCHYLGMLKSSRTSPSDSLLTSLSTNSGSDLECCRHQFPPTDRGDVDNTTPAPGRHVIDDLFGDGEQRVEVDIDLVIVVGTLRLARNTLESGARNENWYLCNAAFSVRERCIAH